MQINKDSLKARTNNLSNKLGISQTIGYWIKKISFGF